MTLVRFQNVCTNKVVGNFLIPEYEEPWEDRIAYASIRVKLETEHVEKALKDIDKKQKASKENGVSYDFLSPSSDLLSPIRP